MRFFCSRNTPPCVEALFAALRRQHYRVFKSDLELWYRAARRASRRILTEEIGYPSPP